MPEATHHDQRNANISCAVLTISDTRNEETDVSGALIRECIEQKRYAVHTSRILPDDQQQVREFVQTLCDDPTCDVVLLTGGTGVSERDTTPEAIEPMLEKKLDGFAELFRMLSFEQIGAAAMLSRAIGGIRQKTIIFAMPGSPHAVRLAMNRLILPQLEHLAAIVE